jgi:hypothetical protein
MINFLLGIYVIILLVCIFAGVLTIIFNVIVTLLTTPVGLLTLFFLGFFFIPWRD